MTLDFIIVSDKFYGTMVYNPVGSMREVIT